jgi:hypothetical protein
LEREYVKRLRDSAKNPAEKAYAAVIDKGMWPQRYADEFACVSGWDAAYRQKLGEIALEDKGAAAREKEAVKRADAVLARTQPSTNVLYQ